MLTLTPEAAQAVDTIVSRPDLPDDEVVEGSQVYVEQGTAEILGDKILDADFAEDQVQFKLRDQS